LFFIICSDLLEFTGDTLMAWPGSLFYNCENYGWSNIGLKYKQPKRIKCM